MSAPLSQPPARPFFWAGLFVFNMAVITIARILGWIEQPAPAMLFLLNFILLVPMVRHAKRRQEEKGAMSPALRTYNRRALFAMAAYMLAMIGAGNLHDSVAEGSVAMWALAMVPLVPLMGMLFAVFRYYREETDEYLRQRHVTAALLGLMLVLVAGTTWGFLEMFGLVGHVWAWWVFPVWAIGLGIGTCWPRGEQADAR